MDVIQDFERYLREVLDLRIKVIPWKDERELPAFLRASYLFYEVSLLGNRCLAMVLRVNEEITPSTISKHWNQVQKKWNGFCIYICKAISSYNRKRLIENRIPFVVPGNQSYLPDLGIDLREHFRKQQRGGKLFFSPATQAVVIYGLMADENQKLNPSELAKELGYTSMTISRAFDELESMNIGEVLQKGRERWLYFLNDKEAFWNQVKPLMQSPVKKRVWIKLSKEGIKQIKRLGTISGLSALAQSSMLNDPDLPVYAVSDDVWKTIIQMEIFEMLPSSEEADVEIEIWSYNPKLFLKNHQVDPFSLYMILQEYEDERIESALDKFMRKIKW